MEKSLEQCLSGKRFGLTLSAGFFGFYGHIGFLKGLAERGLVPQAYSGSSAGGLVAGFSAAGLPVSELEALMLAQTRSSFWDPDPWGALIDTARGGHRPTGLLKGARFLKLLEAHLPVPDFEACRYPLRLVAANLSRGTPEIFSQGRLAPRILATCAYPGLFRAVELDGQLYWDGGLLDKAPLLALADSAAALGLEALLVHYLPSRAPEKPPGGTFAYVQGMASAVSALRKEHFQLQLEVLRSRGLPVYVIESRLPQVSPRNMEQGPLAVEAARRQVAEALAKPAMPFC